MDIVSMALLCLALILYAYLIWVWWDTRDKVRLHRLPVKDGDVLVVSGCTCEVAENLERYLGHKAKGVTLIWLESGEGLERLSEKDMAEYGWVRKEKG